MSSPGDHPFKVAHAALDDAVRAAYGMPASADPLRYLLDLNAEVADAEAAGEIVQGPGLPAAVRNPAAHVTNDCITP